jgi:hypothetical protein
MCSTHIKDTLYIHYTWRPVFPLNYSDAYLQDESVFGFNPHGRMTIGNRLGTRRDDVCGRSSSSIHHELSLQP